MLLVPLTGDKDMSRMSMKCVCVCLCVCLCACVCVCVYVSVCLTCLKTYTHILTHSHTLSLQTHSHTLTAHTLIMECCAYESVTSSHVWFGSSRRGRAAWLWWRFLPAAQRCAVWCV